MSIFEPRTNTSRRRTFQQDYARAFDGSDLVIVSRVADAPIYSATGEVTERFSADDLVRDLRARGLDAVALDGPDAIVEQLRGEARPGDVLLVMSNGAFGNIWEKLLASLQGCRCVVVGVSGSGVASWEIAHRSGPPASRPRGGAGFRDSVTLPLLAPPQRGATRAR